MLEKHENIGKGLTVAYIKIRRLKIALAEMSTCAKLAAFQKLK